MPASEVDWIPPLLILAVGIIAGIILLLQVRAKAAVASANGSTSLDDRRRRFDSIVVQLRELQDGSDTFAESDRMSETSRLEVEAALLLREIETLATARMSLLADRRKQAPYGLKGGEDAKVGRDTIIRQGSPHQIAAKGSWELQPGDRVRIETPGGGGFGR